MQTLPALEPLEVRILEIIALARQTHERLSVKDLMSQLKSMREKGWISLAETEDARRKQLELTHAALLHYDKLAKCMMQAAKKAG
jgi:CRISPR/Cas system-associated protein Csm6